MATAVAMAPCAPAAANHDLVDDDDDDEGGSRVDADGEGNGRAGKRGGGLCGYGIAALLRRAEVPFFAWRSRLLRLAEVRWYSGRAAKALFVPSLTGSLVARTSFLACGVSERGLDKIV